MLSRGNTHSRGDGKVVYHVVLVAYDGFNPDEPGTEYKSTQDEAKRTTTLFTQTESGEEANR